MLPVGLPDRVDLHGQPVGVAGPDFPDVHPVARLENLGRGRRSDQLRVVPIGGRRKMPGELAGIVGHRQAGNHGDGALQNRNAVRRELHHARQAQVHAFQEGDLPAIRTGQRVTGRIGGAADLDDGIGRLGRKRFAQDGRSFLVIDGLDHARVGRPDGIQKLAADPQARAAGQGGLAQALRVQGGIAELAVDRHIPHGCRRDIPRRHADDIAASVLECHLDNRRGGGVGERAGRGQQADGLDEPVAGKGLIDGHENRLALPVPGLDVEVVHHMRRALVTHQLPAVGFGASMARQVHPDELARLLLGEIGSHRHALGPGHVQLAFLAGLVGPGDQRRIPPHAPGGRQKLRTGAAPLGRFGQELRQVRLLLVGGVDLNLVGGHAMEGIGRHGAALDPEHVHDIAVGGIGVHQRHLPLIKSGAVERCLHVLDAFHRREGRDPLMPAEGQIRDNRVMAAEPTSVGIGIAVARTAVAAHRHAASPDLQVERIVMGVAVADSHPERRRAAQPEIGLVAARFQDAAPGAQHAGRVVGNLVGRLPERRAQILEPRTAGTAHVADVEGVAPGHGHVIFEPCAPIGFREPVPVAHVHRQREPRLFAQVQAFQHRAQLAPAPGVEGRALLVGAVAGDGVDGDLVDPHRAVGIDPRIPEQPLGPGLGDGGILLHGHDVGHPARGRVADESVVRHDLVGIILEDRGLVEPARIGGGLDPGDKPPQRGSQILVILDEREQVVVTVDEAALLRIEGPPAVVSHLLVPAAEGGVAVDQAGDHVVDPHGLAEPV